jgi:RNA recognition motif-containing protein
VAETGDYYGIMARGLPYDATKNEVAEFFSGCRIRNGHDGIHILVGQDGRLQGEAVIELEGQEDLDKAKQLNNQMMGRRYIEISPLSQAAADQTLASQPGGSSTEFVVRLRGLPYSATSREILDLLNDCQVAGGDKGIRFSFAPDGRPSGEAFVELVSEEDVSKALGHNNEHMGKRYVEIFRATKGQLEWEGRMAEKVGGGSGGVVRLRGLPYRCTEDDIRQFFQDMVVPAGGITLQVDSDGRETGEAYVEFVEPEDAEKALYKDRQMIGHS